MGGTRTTRERPAAAGKALRRGPAAGEAAELRRRLAEAEAARDRAEGALRRGRDDARFVLENIPQLVWRSRPDGDWTWGGPQWTAFTGQSDPRSRGGGWLDAVHPDDRARTKAAWDAASGRSGGPGEFVVEHRLRRAADGAHRWFQTRAVPRHDADGALEWFGTSTDVHALKALQEREVVLLAELRRRVRGSLARMRALVRDAGEAGEAGGAGERLTLRLSGRLEALAHVQTAVIRDPFGGIDLRGLLTEEFRLGGVREGDRVRVRGPRAQLRPRPAEVVALALHELVTNAAAHGALGREGGQLAVAWAPGGGGGGLRLRWAETIPSAGVAPLARRGFGLALLERALPRELGAAVLVRFAPGGLSCRIDLPAACCAPDAEAGGDAAENDDAEP